MSETKYVASVSFGKDSLAMLLLILEKGFPLHEVVFYDTGMEFQAIYSIRDRILPILEEHGVKYTELHPPRPFLFDMLERPKTKRTGEKVCGDSWCGGACRWGTWLKQKALNDYIGDNPTYIGLASDETRRLQKLEPHKMSPLADWEITEADALRLCYEGGVLLGRKRVPPIRHTGPRVLLVLREQEPEGTSEHIHPPSGILEPAEGNPGQNRPSHEGRRKECF